MTKQKTPIIFGNVFMNMIGHFTIAIVVLFVPRDNIFSNIFGWAHLGFGLFGLGLLIGGILVLINRYDQRRGR